MSLGRLDVKTLLLKTYPPLQKRKQHPRQSTGRKIRGTKGKDRMVEDKHVTWSELFNLAQVFLVLFVFRCSETLCQDERRREGLAIGKRDGM